MPRVTAVLVAWASLLGACRLGFDPNGSDDVAGDDAAVVDDGDVDGSSDGSIDGGDAMMLACPSNYTMLPGAGTQSRYRAIDNSSDWDAAEADCEDDGHHLAIPGDASERDAMIAALAGENIWVGVTDRRTELTWLGVTGGVVTYLPWAPLEPDTEDCVYIDSVTSMYVAQGCGSGRRYVCECDGAPADPTSY